MIEQTRTRMKKQKPIKEISYFLRPEEQHEQTRAGHTVLFFDTEGKEHQTHLADKHLSEILSKVDSKPKAIIRRSGGNTRCQPIKMLVYEYKSGDHTHTEIRIRVRFVDFHKDKYEGVVTNKYRTYTKDVLPAEITSSETYHPDQRFILDFGKGMIPIFVVGYYKDKHSRKNIVFANYLEVQKARKAKKGSDHAIQLYHCTKSVLRVATKEEFSLAKKNAVQLINKQREDIIPDCLKGGKKIYLPTGLNRSKTRDHLVEGGKKFIKGKDGTDIINYMEVA